MPIIVLETFRNLRGNKFDMLKVYTIKVLLWDLVIIIGLMVLNIFININDLVWAVYIFFKLFFFVEDYGQKIAESFYYFFRN